MNSITVNGETIDGSQLQALIFHFNQLFGETNDKLLQDILIDDLLYSQDFKKQGKQIKEKKISHWIEMRKDQFPEDISAEDFKTIAKREIAATQYGKEIRRQVHPTDVDRKAFQERQVQRIQKGKLIFIKRILQDVADTDPATASIQLLGIRDRSTTDDAFNQNYIRSYIMNERRIQENPYWSPFLAIDQDIPDMLPIKTKEMLLSLKQGELSDIVDEGGEFIWFAKLTSVEDATQFIRDWKDPYLETELFNFISQKAMKGRTDQLRKDAKIEIA